MTIQLISPLDLFVFANGNKEHRSAGPFCDTDDAEVVPFNTLHWHELMGEPDLETAESQANHV